MDAEAVKDACDKGGYDFVVIDNAHSDSCPLSRTEGFGDHKTCACNAYSDPTPICDIYPHTDGRVAWSWTDPDGAVRVVWFSSKEDELSARSLIERVKSMNP